MKFALTALTVLALGSLAACDRPAQTSSTTIVKEPVAQNDTVAKDAPASSSTTIVQPAAPAASSSATADAKPADSKPESTETTRTTQRVDTPSGSVTKSETTSTTK